MIYDCFTFFDELDLLELRLEVLWETVDRFVVVEGDRTFTGAPKPLHFAENRERFKPFMNRITHVVVRDFPPHTGSAWEYEAFQRNAIARALGECGPDDAVIVSDVDEMVSPDAVRRAISLPGLKAFRQRLFYYFLNCQVAGVVWDKPRMVSFRDYTSAQELRVFSGKPDFGRAWPLRAARRIAWNLRGRPRRGITFVPDGGWHFSYLGSAERMLAKIKAFSHTEYDTPEVADIKAIRRRVERGQDLFGRRHRLKLVPVDDTFPEPVRRNPGRYASLIRGAGAPGGG